MKVKAAVACGLLTTNIAVTEVANATENGLTVYPFGVNTVLNGIMPKPGETQFYNYFQYYSADEYVGPDGNSLIPNFDIELYVDAPRVMHTWENLWEGYTVSSGIIVPYVHLSSSAFGFDDSESGLGDIIIQPLNIGFANDTYTFFGYTALDFSLPTGKYSSDKMANTGVNYASFMPSINVTWFPEQNIELSASLLVQINQENDDTQYKSGSTSVLDFSVGYSINEKVQISLQGFHLQQFTDDKINGVTLLDGNRTRVTGLGPQLRYNIIPGGAIVFKFQREFNAKNHAVGNKLWVQFSMPL